MKKVHLETFIDKYNLNGAIETVEWISKNNQLSITAATLDRNVAVIISTSTIVLDDGSYVIGDTSRLRKELVPFSSTDIELEVETKKGGRKFLLIDKKDRRKSYFPLSDGAVVPPKPIQRNFPPVDISAVWDKSMITWFSKAASLERESDSFTILSDGITARIILGYDRHIENTWKQEAEFLSVNPNAKIDIPISYKASYLKDILSANKEETSCTLNISKMGLITIQFDNQEFSSKYSLMALI
jgi:hypothetical protein